MPKNCVLEKLSTSNVKIKSHVDVFIAHLWTMYINVLVLLQHVVCKIIKWSGSTFFHWHCKSEHFSDAFSMPEWHNDVSQCSSSQRTFCSFLQTLSFNMLCITRPAMTGTKSTAAIPKLI